MSLHPACLQASCRPAGLKPRSGYLPRPCTPIGAGNLAGVVRQSATSRPGTQSVLQYEPFDAMQAAAEALRQLVLPDTASTIGAVVTPEIQSIAEPSTSSPQERALGLRLSQAWKPGRQTSSALHGYATGQMRRCFAVKANLILLPSRRRIIVVGGALSSSPTFINCYAGDSFR